MSLSSLTIWRTLAIVFALASGYLFMQGQRSNDARATEAARDRIRARPASTGPCADTAYSGDRAEPDTWTGLDDIDDDHSGPPTGTRLEDHWIARVALPQPGETMADYRDRVVPLALLVVEPQRQRVARNRTAFEQSAALSQAQRALIDDLAVRTGDALMERAYLAAVSNEIGLPRVKPSNVVGLVRDLAEIASNAAREFEDSLSEDQRLQLMDSDFDVLEYLVIATPWEERLGYRDDP